MRQLGCDGRKYNIKKKCENKGRTIRGGARLGRSSRLFAFALFLVAFVDGLFIFLGLADAGGVVILRGKDLAAVDAGEMGASAAASMLLDGRLLDGVTTSFALE